MKGTQKQLGGKDLTGMSRVVLLAEDDAAMRNHLSCVLQEQGCVVLTAANGEEALELSRAFDGEILMLLIDMEMADIRSHRLYESLMVERPRIEILQMSGHDGASFLGRNITLTSLHKPFTPSALIEEIARLLVAPGGTVRVRDD